jgi:uncharacterized membrane protein YbaN (DUF454 family)
MPASGNDPPAKRAPRGRARHLVLQALGYFFLALGTAGLFLPVVQGILFILIGLVLLAESAPWAARLLLRAKRRFPRIAAKLDEAEARARRWIERLTGRGRGGD